jgi:hypothetical protein
MAESRPITGTEFKILVRIEPVGGIHMKDMRVNCVFYTRMDAPFEVSKDDMIYVDDDSYIALVDTSGMSSGVLRNRITCEVPDLDFHDGYRTEIVDVETGVTLYR